jgi:exodeoxyribonuclease V gamma subunit
MMTSNLAPGFLAIHSDRIEHLRDTVFGWLRSNPLLPLEQEIFLVQSNGVAEWLKMSMAEQLGVCSGVQVMLPARFLWQAYRQVLGPQSVPRRSPYDREPLTWRLMQLLPTLLDQADFAPLAYFLKDGTFERRLQLAQKLADLYDQYQVYRASWLSAWSEGDDVLIDARGQKVALDPGQRWQARLWCAIRHACAGEAQDTGRADVHRRFVEALAGDSAPARLPRRIVLFGVSSLPYQSLEALGALARHSQVIVAAPNPCQYYWGDIISGRELLRAQRRHQRHSPRSGDLSSTPYEQLHAHCNPLLAGWGRLGRDFIRMLDEFDDVHSTRRTFPALRVDVFSEGAGETLLGQVQAAIREMLPLPTQPGERPACDPADASIRFHVAHSAQREVEILHDQLLDIFAETGADGGSEHGRGIQPRDVIVMMPDVDKFAPAIEAVFGQYPRGDKRHVPFEIVDVSARRTTPLLVALDWLLRLPQQRCLQSEVRDLLDVPAIAARFGIGQQDLPRVAQWVEAAGVRWGLDREHREALELAPAGEQNTWIFGIRRMLLGYANGAHADFDGIEPLGQVGGLDAALAGGLARFVDCLVAWQRELALARSPADWGVVADKLLRAFFKAADDADQLTLAQLNTSLHGWLEDCAAASFADQVPLAVLREAWLGPVDEKSLHHRFISGGVTFCTLMPMRALPYRVVCLIGMNDGDFPRRAQRADFDLLALPGMAHPGDRSRREDDRYLMLEALLSARDRLYISWVGRSVRDNSVQPPSVLVAQLRDYLQAGWQDLDLSRLTVEHFLQPFSRHYFEEGSLHTHATEWRAAHERQDGLAPAAALPSYVPQNAALTIAELAYFMAQPVKQFFRRRLKVQFREQPLVGMDDEPFSLDHLEEYAIGERLLADNGPPEALDEVGNMLDSQIERLRREGRLPIGQLAVKLRAKWLEELAPVRLAWLALNQRFPRSQEKVRVSLACGAYAVDDWLDQVRKDGDDDVWLDLTPSRLLANKRAKLETGALRVQKLIRAYVRQLVVSAQGRPLTGYLVGRDCIVRVGAIEQGAALEQIEQLVALWRQGMDAPLPTACRTALALLRKNAGEAMIAYDGTTFQGSGEPPERNEPCLARLWSDYGQLAADPEHVDISTRLYEPLLLWIDGSVEVLPLNHTLEQAAP